MIRSATAAERKIPEVGFCAEKYRLLSAFVSAVKELSDLQKQQVRAVIEGDEDFSRFDALLHEASQRKDLAKYELLTHADTHCC